MVFSSLLFLFRFLPAVILAYYAVPRRFRNGVLFIGSLLFYGWGEPVYITLLLFSTAVDFAHGKWIGHFLEKGRRDLARCLVISSAVINLSLLGFFKYAGFVTETVNRLTGAGLPVLSLALPVGISFYTFQTMSYTIDVYRGKARVQNNIVTFGAYVSMFPQLIAGPIVRYSTIAEELDSRRESREEFEAGVKIFLTGLAKKVLLANPMGELWMQVQGAAADRTAVMAWLGILAFGMQIYFDFSGYSDMAVGLGRMFGFHFPENFRYPYLSRSVTEFWRRWHISLGTWFREYVYIPLGGNRKGRGRQAVNIMIVWLLTGIWHGAGWNFLLWGCYFGVFLLAEKLVLGKRLEKIPAPLGVCYTLLVVFCGWVLFAHEELGAGMEYFRQMAGLGGVPLINDRTVYLMFTSIPLLTAGAVGATPAVSRAAECLNSYEPVRRIVPVFAAGILILCTAFLVNAGYNPFLYFRF